MPRIGLLAIALALFIAPAVRADIFVLANGGRVEGTLINADESPRKQYEIRTEQGELVFAKSQITRHLIPGENEKKYDALLSKMANNLEEHLKMAEFCRDNELDRQRTFHLEQVIKFDPNHREARLTLGYMQAGNTWMKPEDFWASQGYVRDRGAWRLPQEIKIKTAEREYEEVVREWRSKLKIWHSWLNNKKKIDDALTNIKEIKDPKAAVALGEMLMEEKNLQVRMMYIEVLGNLKSGHATSLFIRLAITDPNEVIRDAALDKLLKNGRQSAAQVFARDLSNKDSRRIFLAGVALARMKEPTTVPALIDALVTQHKFVVTSGSPGSTSAGFGSGGSGTFSAGGSSKVITQDKQNESVLQALTAITGVNYGYDEAAWKRWYSESQAPKLMNLRRDP